MRPRAGVDPVLFTTNIVIRDLARRIKSLNTEMRNIDRTLIALIGDTAPSLLDLYGLGPDTAASLLVAAGDNPERLNSERAWAHMCGVTPIAASSGKVTRYRLNRGGDRNANAALYRIVLTRMSSHDQTRQYVARRRRRRFEHRRDHALFETLRRPSSLQTHTRRRREIRVGSDPINRS